MREYATPTAFRAAVEAKLRERARHLGVPAYILRRQAGLERLMVRLMTVARGRWALKGGFALETRLGGRARRRSAPNESPAGDPCRPRYKVTGADADEIEGDGAVQIEIEAAGEGVGELSHPIPGEKRRATQRHDDGGNNPPRPGLFALLGFPHRRSSACRWGRFSPRRA